MSAGLQLGKAYSHAGRIVQVVPGVPFISVEEISWDVTSGRDFNYGTGKQPYSWGEGHDQPVPVTFKMSKTDFMTLQASTVSSTNQDGNVLRLAPFNILCTDTHPQLPVNNTLVDFLIQNFKESSTKDDKDIMVEISGVCREVRFV